MNVDLHKGVFLKVVSKHNVINLLCPLDVRGGGVGRLYTFDVCCVSLILFCNNFVLKMLSFHIVIVYLNGYMTSQ